MAARLSCPCGWTKTYPTLPRAEFNARRHVCKRDDGVRRATRRHRCARCGLEVVYENAGAVEARRWFDKHSCAKHEQALLRANLHADRMALIDRTPKPCLHKEAAHQHGTTACYVLDKCRCLPCAAARKAQDDWRRRQQAYGRYQRYVDASPVREHVRALMDAGMGLKRIVKVSGVSQGALWKLMYGKRQADGTQAPSRRVLRETAEKLYALDPAWGGPLPLADGQILDEQASAAAARKLQALVALGWSMSAIGRRLGLNSTRNAIPVVRGERRLTVATAKKADALFDELCMTLPTAETRFQQAAITRSLNFAKQHGWLPPLALDDLDPTCNELLVDIDEVAIERRMGGDKTVQLSSAERVELVHRWTASGRPLSEMQRITGINTHRHQKRAS
jgi:hypothetical protein